MNLTFVRLNPLVRAVRSVHAELRRMNDLKEIELQHVGINLHPERAATKSDLDETMARETEVDFAEFAERMERESGRKLTDEEAAMLFEAMQEEK